MNYKSNFLILTCITKFKTELVVSQLENKVYMVLLYSTSYTQPGIRAPLTS